MLHYCHAVIIFIRKVSIYLCGVNSRMPCNTYTVQKILCNFIDISRTSCLNESWMLVMKDIHIDLQIKVVHVY